MLSTANVEICVLRGYIALIGAWILKFRDKLLDLFAKVRAGHV